MMLPSIFGDSLFNDFFDDFSRPFVSGKGFEGAMNAMKTDVRELDDHYELDIDIPGVDKENVKAQVQNGYLNITATHGSSNDEKDKDGKYIRKERYYGTVSRSFYVGDSVKNEDIKARFDKGILKLSIPKLDPAKAVEKDDFIAIEG